MDWIFRIFVGVVLIVVCGCWLALNVMESASGRPDTGPLRGWGPVLTGLAGLVLGVLILVW
jgi:hypothetical protein